jgi:hypothetical protein
MSEQRLTQLRIARDFIHRVTHGRNDCAGSSKYAEPRAKIQGRIYILEQGYVGEIRAPFMADDRQQLGLAGDDEAR